MGGWGHKHEDDLHLEGVYLGWFHEVNLLWVCFHEDGREGGLMQMIALTKVAWSSLRWSREVGL